MRVLALEPYYGGSHRAYLDGCASCSAHDWTVLGLPGCHWKWRMRHGAVTLAERIRTEHPDAHWDLLFASAMLDLPQFLGLARSSIGRLPTVVYFHENQLTYPVRCEEERDLHFAVTNMITAYAADRVWFNSAFHRDEFFQAAEQLVRRLPPGLPSNMLDGIERKTSVEPPGITPPKTNLSDAAGPRASGPMRILWAARWEFDKRPEDFFAALDGLVDLGIDFRVSVVGEQFRDVPPVFAEAKQRLASHVDRWGYLESRAEYQRCLRDADVIVSTAIHEFFGLSVVEAIAAGARPLLPKRLAYPEILAPLGERAEEYFYDGSVGGLTRRLAQLAGEIERGALVSGDLLPVVERYFWNRRIARMDTQLQRIVSDRTNAI